MEKLAYLLLSVSLTSGRNIISKKTAVVFSSRAQFFLSQTILFAVCALLLSLIGAKGLVGVSDITVIYGIIYGVLLILSQWMLTLSLKSGDTSICTVIYSLGFILPTVSGAIFWDEVLTILNLIGVVVAIAVVLLSAKGSKNEKQSSKLFVVFIVVAMLASGGLGIMQKVQQMSSAADEKGTFLFIAFIVAFLSSLFAFLLCRQKPNTTIKNAIYPAAAGLCFGAANFCNTVLAGKMKSAIFFPLQNVSTILLSTLLGILIFKEKITLKTAIILLLGTVVIVLFSL